MLVYEASRVMVVLGAFKSERTLRTDFNMIETSLALSTDWRNHYAGYYPKVTDVYPYGVNAFSQPVYTFTVFR